MSSGFSIQRPHVIAVLPQPIDQANGRYVVGEVLSGGAGSKKRKRSELAVGTDGEGLGLYDVISSKLITSYALPPQSTFTCPPVSVRTRVSKKSIERISYASTATPQAQITRFRDLVTGTATDSSSSHCTLTNSSSPVVYLGTISALKSAEASATIDVLVVLENGEILCMDGESLKEKWGSPASALLRDMALHKQDSTVEFVHLTNAFAARQGILKGREDLLAIYPQEISEDGFNPEILVIVTSSVDDSLTPIKNLHILGLRTRQAGSQHGINTLLTAVLPLSSGKQRHTGRSTFSLQAGTGILQQLQNDTLTTYDLSDALPKAQNALQTTDGQSFLRLSGTSVLISSLHSVTVYNPKYQSTLATIELDGESNSENRKRKRDAVEDGDVAVSERCKFIAYFPKTAMATAIMGNKLIGIQVEGHQDRRGKPRNAGLLIDSVGRYAVGQSRPVKTSKTGVHTVDGVQTLGEYLPTSVGDDTPWNDQIHEAEALFRNCKADEDTFDLIVGPHLGMDAPYHAAPIINGTSEGKNKSKTEGARKNKPLLPADVDRRWILYALGKIFTMTEYDAGDAKLAVKFYPEKTFSWLLEQGFMTVANIEAGMRRSCLRFKSISPGQLVDAIVNLDEDMNILLALVAENFLEAAELLHAIRYLMESLGMIGEKPNTKQGLLTNGDDIDMPDGDIDQKVEELEDQIEQELELAEYRLGPGSGTRGHALSLALSRLYTRPGSDVVRALQTTFSTQETVGLIYLLRFELARGAWTTKYTDGENDVVDEDAGEEDNAIILISSLMNSCIDAIGAGGWLSGEARLVGNDPFEAEELISGLKMEVSAALEGIEEAVYLKGLTSEMLRYSDAVQASGREHTKGAPLLVRAPERNAGFLPVGLKVEKEIPIIKVGAGGAVYKRSMRDIGHLRSQKVGKYSRERIVI